MDQRRFLAAFGDDEGRAAAERLLTAAAKSEAILAWGTSGLSVRVRCSIRDEPISVAWLFPPSVKGWMGLTEVSFGEAVCTDDWPRAGSDLRRFLDQWVEQFSRDDFATDTSKSYLRAWTVSYAAVTSHIDLLESRLRGVISRLKSI